MGLRSHLFDWYGTNGEVSVFWIKALILLAIIWAGIYLVATVW